MNRLGRGAIMMCLGVVLGRLLWTGGFGWFVQQRMRWPLILATGMLLFLGGLECFRAINEERDAPETATRSVAPSIGWMLILPLVVLLSVAPTGLGAAAADRVDAYVPTQQNNPFEPLPETGLVEMRVFDFLDRAVWDEDRSLEDRVVRLEGLVVNDPAIPDGFRLTRFSVSCCAADGIPLQVALRNTVAPLENDTWVTADVVWIPPSVPYIETEGEWIIEAEARSLEIAPAGVPNDPYESPY